MQLNKFTTKKTDNGTYYEGKKSKVSVNVTANRFPAKTFVKNIMKED